MQAMVSSLPERAIPGYRLRYFLRALGYFVALAIVNTLAYSGIGDTLVRFALAWLSISFTEELACRGYILHRLAQAVEGMAPGSLSETGQAGPLYALVRLQVYHQRAAEALDRCPAAGRLTLFLDDYATQPLIEKAGPNVSQEEDCGH
jgi:hypothetical protein